MNNRLALISTTGIMLLTLTGCASSLNATGADSHPTANSTVNTSHVNTHQNATANSSDANAVPSSSSEAALSTQQLSFQIQDKLLRQMYNPGQGEDCLNSSCSVSGTSFSGPSATNSTVTLNMVYAKFKGWYIIVAPTTGNALNITQQLIQKPFNFPYPTGVMVVHSKTADYYWLYNGKENLKSEKLP